MFGKFVKFTAEMFSECQNVDIVKRPAKITDTGKTCCLCVHQRLSALIGYVVLLRSVTEYIGERSNRGVCYNRVACNHGILGL